MPTNRGGDHEAVYRRYRELVAGRASHGHVLESVIRGDPQHKRLVKAHGAGVFSEAEIRCATDLRPAWRAAAHKGQAANDPFDDAYQAGFWIHLHQDRYVRQDNDSKLYRGQRNADWTNTASLFRPGKLSPELRRDRLLSLAGTLADRLGLDDTHTFAACQHYAEMARLDGDDEGFGATSTWLLDVTWNPFIALAFATHGAVDGDLGAVALLSRPEWNSRLAAVAPLDLVELDLRRPRQQQAGFINSRYPELFEDYIPYRLYFRQHGGREFEDDGLGASRPNIYPVDDPVRDVVREWAEEEKRLGHPPPPPTVLALPEQATRPVPARAAWIDPGVYFQLCVASFESADEVGTSDPTTRRPHFELLAVFHSWARFLKPKLQLRLHPWNPGLGGLLDGAWRAHMCAAAGLPANLATLTDQYNSLEDNCKRQLVTWVESRWRISPAARDSLWNGTADPAELLASVH